MLGWTADSRRRRSSALDADGSKAMTSQKVTRFEAARRQIDQAIRLFFQRGDAVSIHTLSAAALQILRDIAKKRNVPYMGQQILGLIRPERQKEFWNKLREAEGFFKHADQGAEDLEIAFAPVTSEFFLFEAIELYRQLTGTSFPAATAYWTWFFVKNQSLALDEVRVKAQALVAGLDPNDYSDFIEFMEALERDPALTNSLVNAPIIVPRI